MIKDYNANTTGGADSEDEEDDYDTTMTPDMNCDDLRTKYPDGEGASEEELAFWSAHCSHMTCQSLSQKYPHDTMHEATHEELMFWEENCLSIYKIYISSPKDLIFI